MRIRVKVISGESFRVDLPTYSMVPASWRPLIPNIIHEDGVFPDVNRDDPRLNGLTCEVDVPDNIINPNSNRPDIALIRSRYRGQPRWDTDDRELDI